MSKKKPEKAKSHYAYTAKTKYDGDCINAFCRARFVLFQKKKQALCVVICLALITVGVLKLLGTVGAVICIPLGCWLLTAIGSFPKSDADRMIDASEGKFPVSEYGFDASGFDITSGSQSNRLEYESMIYLAEDDYYFFFFATPKLAYMVHKPSLRPISEEGFRDYTARHSGLEWETIRPWYEFRSKLSYKLRKNRK